LIDIDTNDVLEAASTKWNFLRFTPGLVGGHCIGVDPYYLTHRAERAGYHPEVILAGRRVNDSTGYRVARQCMRMLMRRSGAKGLVTVLGFTFKENVPDTRNSKVVDIVRELRGFSIPVQVHDPIADPEETEAEYGVKLLRRDELQPADALIFAVPHENYLAEGWPLVTGLLKNGSGVVLDVKGKLPRSERPEGVDLWRL
jgi:UDP-N-acetyl-D-galactosamine dehydrogenase